MSFIGPRIFFTLAFMAAALCFPLRAADVQEGDEYEPPPEGFEERTYSIQALCTVPPNYDAEANAGCVFEESREQLGPENVIDIIKYCVAPDSWTRRGPARMESSGSNLVILQKKEVHDEIARVLSWLRDASAASFRGSVIAVTLKPEVLAKIAGDTGIISPADLMKAIEDAGEKAAAEILELRGQERQAAFVNGSERQNYIGDYDVAGAIYDPVIRSLSHGLKATAVARRMPDCLGCRVDLDISVLSPVRMGSAQMKLHGISATAVQSIEVPKKEGDKITTETKNIAGKESPAPINAVLNIALPDQVSGGLRTTIYAPRGAYALAGVVDLSQAGGERRAIFVRAAVGDAGIPELKGVSGLKEGETFKLYPLSAGSSAILDYPGPAFFGQPDLARADHGNIGNPFSQTPAATPSLTTPSVTKAQMMFSEKVRKNKIVEARGGMLFTRLGNDDHAKLLKNLTQQFASVMSPIRVRAVAIAVPADVLRKTVAEDSADYDPAAIDNLAKGNALLMDANLVLANGQRAHVFGGDQLSVLGDYDISGDAYDPVIKTVLSLGNVLDLRPQSGPDGSRIDCQVRWRGFPTAVKNDCTTLQCFTVNGGASVSITLDSSSDLDRLKLGVINVSGNVRVPAGKFVLAGSAPMPPDAEGKADPRHALLFLRADGPK